MRDEQHRRAPLAVDAPERLEVLEPVARIEPRGGLVEQPDLGLLGEGASEEHAPPLPARERRGVALGEALDVAGAHRLERDAPVLRPTPRRTRARAARGPAGRGRASGSGRRDRRSAARRRSRRAVSRRGIDSRRPSVEADLAPRGRRATRARTFSRLDLPEPFSPRTATTSPDAISASRPRERRALGRSAPRARAPRARRCDGALTGSSEAARRRAARRAPAVIAPIGSSAGATAARETASATTSRAAPARAESGRSARWSLPASSAHAVRHAAGRRSR